MEELSCGSRCWEAILMEVYHCAEEEMVVMRHRGKVEQRRVFRRTRKSQCQFFGTLKVKDGALVNRSDPR